MLDGWRGEDGEARMARGEDRMDGEVRMARQGWQRMATEEDGDKKIADARSRWRGNGDGEVRIKDGEARVAKSGW